MKIRPYIRIRAGTSLLGIIGIASFFVIFAQSGRIIPPDSSVPPLTETTSSKAKSTFVPDPNAETYKLVFATNYLWRGNYTAADEEEHNRAINSFRANWKERMNEAGAQRYRIISVVNGIALAKLDKMQYDYALLYTSSNVFFSQRGFEIDYAPFAKQGFSVIQHKTLSSACDEAPYRPNQELPEIPIKNCTYHAQFILGRTKGDESPQTYRLAQHIPRWRELTGEALLTSQLNEDLARDFFPTHAFSKYEVLSQRASDHRLNAREEIELRVLTGDIQKKVNELAQQGYRLTVTNYEIAVMVRRRGETTATSYIWLDATKKDFAKRLAQVQEQGGGYLSSYPTRHGDESKLIFELPSAKKNAGYEFKILKFEIERKRVSSGDENVTEDFTAASKETLKTLNQLVKEGFAARDLFISDKNTYSGNSAIFRISLLLERSR